MRCNGAWRRRRWRRRRRVDATAPVRGPAVVGLHPREPPRRRRALQSRGRGAKARAGGDGSAGRSVAARPGRMAALLDRLGPERGAAEAGGRGPHRDAGSARARARGPGGDRRRSNRFQRRGPAFHRGVADRSDGPDRGACRGAPARSGGRIAPDRRSHHRRSARPPCPGGAAGCAAPPGGRGADLDATRGGSAGPGDRAGGLAGRGSGAALACGRAVRCAAALRSAPGAPAGRPRCGRRAEGTRFRLTLARADGDASDLTSAVPRELAGARAAAVCELGEPCIGPPAWTDRADLRAAASAMLEADPADALAAWLLARAAMGDDRALSRAAVDRSVLLSSSGAPSLALRAQQLLHDPEVPDRIGRARALADLVEAARKDPLLLRARLTAAALERDSERFDDAQQELDRAEAALREEKAPPSPRVLAARARLLDARGNSAGARVRAKEALQAAPGRCDTLQLLLDLSRRDGSFSDQREYAEGLVGCTDGLVGAAQAARSRGDLSRAEELLKVAAAFRPAQPSRLEQLADVQSARKENRAAVASLRAASALVPRSPEPLRRLGGALELLGESKAAADARRAALRLAPGDLQLRQQIALDEGGRLLSWSDRDGAILAKGSKDAPPGASAVRLLDFGAAQMYADGGGVERVHTVARVVDKKGVAKFGEAQIPSDVQVVHLRTLKADGRVLEPESIPEKEGISLPGLEPGDAGEIDYVRGISPRGPDMPGYSLAAFFFRDDETPMGESTYEVRAPAPPEIDAHNLDLPKDAIQPDGNSFRFRYSARDVKPLQNEPHQVVESEVMPWVQLGSGAGQKDLMRSLADWALMRARPGSATLELAKRSLGTSVENTARKIHANVAEAGGGRSDGSDFQASARHVLAHGRGNRLLVMKAALASAQIPSHIVFARTFLADPAPHRFPRGDLYGYAVLRIDLPGGPAWVDVSYRLAPFNQLPAFLRGQDGWVVPEPGEEPEYIRLPQTLPGQRDGRSLQMELTLDPEGVASGTGRDEHQGFEAATLKDALERLDAEQRKQAVESTLGRGLRGVTLESLATEQ